MADSVFQFDAVSPRQRCVQSDTGRFQNWPIGDCFFGVHADDVYGRIPLTDIPDNATGFHFYLGADQESLLRSFLESDLPARTTSLHIGNSSYCLGKGRDYSQLGRLLSGVDFPNLGTLELGTWQRFSAEHCAYGIVGSIDWIASRAPNLRVLCIYGHCSLDSPSWLPYLQKLHIVVDDPTTGVNGGALDTLTVTNILRSSFPMLREHYLDLEIDDKHTPYTIPDEFFSGELLPNARTFELVGTFCSGEKRRLLESPFLRGRDVRTHLDRMVECGRDTQG